MRYRQLQRQGNKTMRQMFEYDRLNDREKRKYCVYDNVREFSEKHTEFVGQNHQSGHIEWNGTLDWGGFFDARDRRFVNMMKTRKQHRKQLKNFTPEQLQWASLVNTFRAVPRQTSWEASNNKYQAALMQLNNLMIKSKRD